MKNYQKYEKSYFMPPEVTYDWAKKDSVEQPPKWRSVDLRAVSYTHLTLPTT